MKRALLLSVCLLVVSSLAFAQTGSIGLFADPGGTSCDLQDALPGLYSVYVVHVFTPGATGAQFMVTWDPCMLMTYLSETVTPPYLQIGTSLTGTAIAYGACVGSPNMITTLQFFAQALTGPCCMMHVVADPTEIPPGIYVTNCDDPPLKLSATGGEAYINNDGSCPCDVPTEETSWGQIKSLYQ
jgi:hypothetical protein